MIQLYKREEPRIDMNTSFLVKLSSSPLFFYHHALFGLSLITFMKWLESEVKPS